MVGYRPDVVTMRCTQCGTPSDPESRFCGTCGARMPTVPPGLRPSGPSPVSAPPPLAASDEDDAAAGSSVLAAVRRPTGARVAIVLVDVAMLVIGGLLLRAGLAAAPASAASPGAAADAVSSGSASGSAAATPSDAPAGSAADRTRPGGDGVAASVGTAVVDARTGSASPSSGSGGVATVGGSGAGQTGSATSAAGSSDVGSGAAGVGSATVLDARPPDAAPAAAGSGSDSASGGAAGSGSGSAAEPSYEIEAQIASEVGRLTARSQSKFDACHARASKALPPEAPLRGEIAVSFSVNPSGSVAAVRALSNSTGSTELSACLVAIVETWAFSTTAATSPLEFRRTFRF